MNLDVIKNVIEDLEGIGSLADVNFSGQAKDYIDFLVIKGYESALFFYVESGIMLGEFTFDNLDEHICENIFPICNYLNYRFSNLEFQKFLTERGYR